MKVDARLELPGRRWVLDCPRPLCYAAYRVWPDGRRLDVVTNPQTGRPEAVQLEYRKRFTCGCRDDVACLHEEVCGQVIEPVFPDDIETGLAVLNLRPPEIRGWMPGQTVDDLIAENLAVGIPVP